MNKKIIFVVGGIMVVSVGYWLISPLFITRRVNEKLEDILPPVGGVPLPSRPPPALPSDIPYVEIKPLPPLGAPRPQPALKLVSQGSFVGRAGHSGAGTAKLLQMGNKYYVRFEDDFQVTNGPDLFVYFGKDGQYVSAARLGALKGNVGGQNYEVPTSLNPGDYNEVWVWCRAFSVPFARAVLK